MLHTFKGAIKTYFKSLDVIMLFSLVLGLALLLPMVFPQYFFWTFSGIFLRISKLTDIPLVELIISLVLYAISLLLFTLGFLLITQVVKEYRSDYIRREILWEIIKKQYPKLALFFLSLFMVIFAIGIFAYVYNVPSVVSMGVFFIVGYLLFFVPFAMAIDEYDLNEAFRNLWKTKHRIWHYPFVYALVLSVMMLGVALFFLIITRDLELTRVLSNVVNALILVPFGIILASHFYFDKYTLSIREI